MLSLIIWDQSKKKKWSSLHTQRVFFLFKGLNIAYGHKVALF